MLSVNHLRYFHDAALLGGVAVAAKKHRVSASAVSQAIRGLESHLGLDLLRHNRNRFELTAEGRTLFEHSFAVLTAVERLEQEMAWTKKTNSGTVTFATQQSIAHHLLPGFLAHLRKTYPDVRIKVRLGTTEVVKQWLEQREVDFILSVNNVAYDAFRSLPVLEGRYILVESSTRRNASPHEFLLPSGTRESSLFRRSYEQETGAAPRVLMEIDSWGVIKRLAEQGLGIGLIPDYLLRFESGSHKVREVDLSLPKMPFSIDAYYCSRRNLLSKASRLFLDELETFGADPDNSDSPLPKRSSTR